MLFVLYYLKNQNSSKDFKVHLLASENEEFEKNEILM